MLGFLGGLSRRFENTTVDPECGKDPDEGTEKDIAWVMGSYEDSADPHQNGQRDKQGREPPLDQGKGGEDGKGPDGVSRGGGVEGPFG